MAAPTSEGLHTQLYGSGSLQDRLQLAEKAFLAPLPIPATHKEDVVILWLSQLITRKASLLSSEELLMVWTTLNNLLNTKRLKALTNNKWLCPITSSFTEVLIDVINSSTENAVVQMAVNACYSLISIPQLAHLVTHSLEHCLHLTKGLLKWLLEGHKSKLDVDLATLVVMELATQLRTHTSRAQARVTIINQLLIPSAALLASLKKDEMADLATFLKELENILYSNLFPFGSAKSYKNTLDTFFSEETKRDLSSEVDKLLLTIVSAVESEDVEIAEVLISRFFTEFVSRQKNDGVLHYQILVVLCHILGISLSGARLPSIVENTIAAQKLKASDITQKKQESLLCSILSSSVWDVVDLSVVINGKAPLSTWLEHLVARLVRQVPETVSGYQCLQRLVGILPPYTTNMVLKELWNIYCFKNSEAETRSESLYSAYDELLCEVLEVRIKSRTTPTVFKKILIGLRENARSLKDHRLIPESMLLYDGKLLLPPRFMLALMKAVGTLSHVQVLDIWRNVILQLVKSVSYLQKESAASGEWEMVSLLMWLLSCTMKASPILQVASVAGMASSLAERMMEVAVSAIKPGITAILTQPHNNEVCGSLLALCHTWGETHRNLLTSDLGYKECIELPANSSPAQDTPTDFSYLLPFISSEEWQQISTRVSNFGNKTTQLSLVQLVIQKLSNIALKQQESMVYSSEKQLEQCKSSPEQQMVEAISKFLMDALDNWGKNVSGLITLHLPYILPFIEEKCLPVLGKHLVQGINGKDKSWQDYVHSQYFQEATRLHPHVFLSICSNFACLSKSRKRTFSETENPTISKNYWTKLMKKLAKGAPCLPLGAEAEEAKVLKMLQDCGHLLKELVNETENEKEIIDYEENSNGVNVKGMINLLGHFPLAYLTESFQSALLITAFALLFMECQQSKQHGMISILNILNKALCSHCPLKIFSYIDPTTLLQWLVKVRLSLPVTYFAQHCVNMAADPVMKKLHIIQGNIGHNRLKKLSEETLQCKSLDHLINELFHRVCYRGTADDVMKLAEHFSTCGDSGDPELVLHPAVFLLAACSQNQNQACRWAFFKLSALVLRYLKKMDLTTTAPATAAAVLSAHTLIILTNLHSKSSAGKKKRKPDISSDKKEEPEETPDSSTVDQALAAEGSASTCLPQEKTPKWQKLLQRSFQLTELCLAGGDPELQEYAVIFLLTVAHHSDIIKCQFSSHLLDITWKAFCSPKQTAGENDTLRMKCSLEPILLNASPQDYKKLLQDLLWSTQTNKSQLLHNIDLWNIIISSKVFKANGQLKCEALEHLIPVVVNLLSGAGPGQGKDRSLCVPLIRLLHKILNTGLKFEQQSKAQVLIPCTTLQLETFSILRFSQVFKVCVKIISTLLKHHLATLMERTPLLLAAFAHLATSLISQASQDHNLDDKQVNTMVHCCSQLELLARALNPLSLKMNKIVHFTMATIVGALQQTTVYPSVKVVMETIIYYLLDLCDSYCMTHLLVALPPATTTLLKHLHNNYRTFHRFNPRKS